MACLLTLKDSEEAFRLRTPPPSIRDILSDSSDEDASEDDSEAESEKDEPTTPPPPTSTACGSTCAKDSTKSQPPPTNEQRKDKDNKNAPSAGISGGRSPDNRSDGDKRKEIKLPLPTRLGPDFQYAQGPFGNARWNPMDRTVPKIMAHLNSTKPTFSFSGLGNTPNFGYGQPSQQLSSLVYVPTSSNSGSTSSSFMYFQLSEALAQLIQLGPHIQPQYQDSFYNALVQLIQNRPRPEPEPQYQTQIQMPLPQSPAQLTQRLLPKDFSPMSSFYV